MEENFAKQIMQSAINEALDKAKKKENVFCFAGDTIQNDEPPAGAVGIFGGEVVTMAYLLCKMMEKEPLIFHMVDAALQAYKRAELEKSKN